MTVQALLQKQLLNELAQVIGVGGPAELVLTTLGVNPARAGTVADGPNAAQVYWLRVCNALNGGMLTGDHRLERLLGAAYTLFPGNELFAKFKDYAPAVEPDITVPAPAAQPAPAQPVAQPPVPPPVAVGQLDAGAVIRITGGNPQQVIAAAQQVAAARQPVARLVPIMTGAGGVLFHAPDLRIEDAVDLGEAIRAELAKTDPKARAYAATREARDYMIGRIYAEGPDQTRFELNGVRGTTKVDDVARGIMGEYDPKMWGQDHQGQLRPSVVDHVTPEGTKRLDPDTTLADNNVQDGDTLEVHPETTAGVHPHIREEALARACKQVIAYARQHPEFGVEANARQMPTEYLFRFPAGGWGPPPAAGQPPVPVDNHEVFLYLPPEFPMKSPEVFFRTPMFHPNVHPDNGFLCLGPVGWAYSPGLDFAQLCQMIVDIAAFRNYAVGEGLPDARAAQEWVMSPEGQAAIESRGGQSVTRKILHELRTPRPLNIRRVDQ